MLCISFWVERPISFDMTSSRSLWSDGVMIPPYEWALVILMPLCRHFSHVTKSRIIKNRNMRKKKANRSFCNTFLENNFKHLKLYSNPPSWLARSRCHVDTFKRQKIEVHIFERANLSDFGTWNLTTKEDLIRQKQVFILDFRPWPGKKPKIWPILYGNSLIKKIL